MNIKAFKLPILLLLIVLITLKYGNTLPLYLQQLFYSISLLVSSLLSFFMPLIIFGLLFSSLIRINSDFLWLIILLFPTVCLSNFFTTMLAYFSGKTAITKLGIGVLSTTAFTMEKELMPLWTINLPKIISNQNAMLMALILAILSWGLIKTKSKFEKPLFFIADLLNKLVNRILHYGFVPILPLFIFGFLLKLQYDGLLGLIVNKYDVVFLTVLVIQSSYMIFLYAVANNFNYIKMLNSLKNMLPAWIVGFTTMSSAAAMPLTLNATISNTENAQVARLIIPATVNVHLIGDCLAIPIFALTIINSLGLAMPGVIDYAIFAGYFALARFAAAAVPAGGVIVILPILEQYFGFNLEMCSLITMLYVLFDCVNTSTNVLGNGAFAIMFNKVIKNLTK